MVLEDVEELERWHTEIEVSFSSNYGSNSAVNGKLFSALSSYIILHLEILGKQTGPKAGRKRKKMLI